MAQGSVEEGLMLEQGSLHLPSVQGAWEVSLGFPDVSLLPAFPSPGSQPVWGWLQGCSGSQNPQSHICSDQQAMDTVRKGHCDEGCCDEGAL